MFWKQKCLENMMASRKFPNSLRAAVTERPKIFHIFMAHPVVESDEIREKLMDVEKTLESVRINF